MRRLENKVAVIAGGAGGIGTATSIRVAGEGAAVVVADINIKQAETVAETIRASGGRAISCRLDLADKATIHAMFEIAMEHFDAVDLLHCNAAYTGALDKDLDALEISEETCGSEHFRSI